MFVEASEVTPTPVTPAFFYYSILNETPPRLGLVGRVVVCTWWGVQLLGVWVQGCGGVGAVRVAYSVCAAAGGVTEKTGPT